MAKDEAAPKMTLDADSASKSNPQDRAAHAVAQWAAEFSDWDLAPMEALGRLGETATVIDVKHLSPLFAYEIGWLHPKNEICFDPSLPRELPKLLTRRVRLFEPNALEGKRGTTLLARMANGSGQTG